MLIILFFLLVAVWAAVLLPSVMSARREQSVNATPPSQGTAVRPSGRQSDASRQAVLARRRSALIALGFGAVLTLVAAIVTGSVVLLVLTLVFDVLLALYVAVLLQVKQRKYQDWEGAAESRADGDPPVKVVGG